MQFAKLLGVHFPTEVLAGGKCLGLQKIGTAMGRHGTCKSNSSRAELRGGSETKNQNTNLRLDMNFMEVKGIWNIARGRLKQKFAELTDDDLQFREGKKEDLIGRIHKRSGRAKGDRERVVRDGCANTK